MLVWAAHDGGYDSDTWYWGALLLLSLLAVLIGLGCTRRTLSRASVLALTAFGLYVAWSYLSIIWAGSPGSALDGSNRALLYLLLFAVMLLLPWRSGDAASALMSFVLGVGVIAAVLLVRLAWNDNISDLLVQGRLAAPTGYINATAALFTANALTATVLAARRGWPAGLRALLLTAACASWQLAVIVQSRGWLFTLPAVAVLVIIVASERLRVVAAAVIPLGATLLTLHRLLDVYRNSSGSRLEHVAMLAGQAALIVCGVTFVIAALVAWADNRFRLPALSPGHRRLLGVAVAVLALSGVAAGGVAATHGHPVRFIVRQWHGFSHPETGSSSGSHFAAVGTSRSDFWRVSLDAVVAHPVLGLGQDNFADYYVVHRHTSEEPSWTHSLELRLLAQTGIVGFLLFAVFLGGAIIAAVRARRGTDPMTRWIAGAALVPLVVWLVHGSVDWFWEMPTLSGPALGFLALAGSLGEGETSSGSAEVRAAASRPSPGPRRRLRRIGLGVGLAVGFVAAAVVLGFSYLSVREVSTASNVGGANPPQALHDLAIAADLNPLSPIPARLAGTIALQSDQFTVAEDRFRQATIREPGGWFAWFGAGLAASALGNHGAARTDFERARAINSRQPAIATALARVDGSHPLSPDAGLRSIVVVGR